MNYFEIFEIVQYTYSVQIQGFIGNLCRIPLKCADR
jgi:hypothetical protein